MNSQPEFLMSLEKMGFSFFAGYAIGFAVRFLSKIAMFFLGAFFLGLFILQFNGILVVDWGSLNQSFSVFSHSFSNESQVFLNYMKGNLQNGVAFIGGFVVGFRR